MQTHFEIVAPTLRHVHPVPERVRGDFKPSRRLVLVVQKDDARAPARRPLCAIRGDKFLQLHRLSQVRKTHGKLIHHPVVHLLKSVSAAIVRRAHAGFLQLKRRVRINALHRAETFLLLAIHRPDANEPIERLREFLKL